MTDDEMRAVFAAQHAASRSQPAPDAATRRARLAMLGDLILDNRDAFADAISRDFGHRAKPETELLEIVPALRGIRHARKLLGRWMKPDRRAVDIVFQPARAWVRYEPLGVIGIIAPWNYPLLLALSPLADALAAGNRAMLKPSELTPGFSALLARLIAERFNPAVVAVVIGGVEVAKAFSTLPFDHLLFTGSTAVGRHVMRAAAENLMPVTLELGGKSPAIVAPGYPLGKAARSVAFGKFVNAGQTCIAPDYALVPAGQTRTFADAVLAEAARGYPTIAGNDDYSAIITPRHRERLIAGIEQARAAGATVLTHGDAGNDPAKIAPTIVIDAPVDGMLMGEEIFGPVLPVVGYDTIDDALRYVAARDRPLALYVFADSRGMQDHILSGTISGGVTINGTLLHIAQDTLPFGGIGPSGMGAYHGFEGFLRFSHARGVHRIGPINVFERLGPPWGGLARVVARQLARK